MDAEFYILLNSDIEVTENWIQPVIQLMDSDPMIAACQPTIRSYYHPEKFEYAGAAGGFIDRYGYPFCRGRIFQHLEVDKGQYADPIEVFWATGACMFVRADVSENSAVLMKIFLPIWKRLIFARAGLNMGIARSWFARNNKSLSCRGGTLPKQSSFKTYLNMRNNISLLYKNLPSDQLLPIFASRLILDGVAAFKFLIDGGFADFWAVEAHIELAEFSDSPEKKARNQAPECFLYL